MTVVTRLAWAAAATGLAGVVASVTPLLWPDTDRPVRADAVVVLSGDHGERLARALELVDRGVTSTLVFDGALDTAKAVQLCAGEVHFEVICLKPEPDDTRHEARALAALAAERRWTNVVVATSNYHVARAALLFDRCTDVDLQFVGGDPPYGTLQRARAVAREWVAIAYAVAFARSC